MIRPPNKGIVDRILAKDVHGLVLHPSFTGAALVWHITKKSSVQLGQAQQDIVASKDLQDLRQAIRMAQKVGKRLGSGTVLLGAVSAQQTSFR